MNKTWWFIIVILTAIGAINWGLVGAFDWDLVAAICGRFTIFARIIYIIIGICGIILLVGCKRCCKSHKDGSC